MLHLVIVQCQINYADLPLTTTIVLLELFASSKPLTDTEQVYCPRLLLSNGENVIILVYCDPFILVVLIIGSIESWLSQLTLTSDDDTPLATMTVQVRVRSSPTLGLSPDCDIIIDDRGTINSHIRTI